ncbi:MAG: TCP-1/cpn60 chaperonin family protein [Thermomicrobiales bacterium]
MSSMNRHRMRYSYGIVSGARVADDFARGVRDLTDLIRPVYGASGRFVASAGPLGASAPELLHDGAVIARRLTELDDRLENAGAMFLRSLLQQIDGLAGDGVATGALIFETIYTRGRSAIAAGHDPVRLRNALLRELEVVFAELRRQRRLPMSRQDLRLLAQSVGKDNRLAAEIATIVDVVGPLGMIEVRPGSAGQIGHDYIDESYWPTRPLERSHLDATWGMRSDISLCAVFVSDLNLETRDEALALLKAARHQEASSLLIFARSCGPQCRSVLLANASPAFRVLIIATPGNSDPERWESMEDIAMMTGAHVYHAAAGSSSSEVTSGDLGYCRRAWATRTHVGFVGGHGDGRALRHRVAALTMQFQTSIDPPSRERTRRRLSRLTGRGAILWVDGLTDREIAFQRSRAERTARVVQRALTCGYVPGGGVALLVCANRLVEESNGTFDTAEDRVAIEALRNGLLTPVATLAKHANLNPAVTIAQLESQMERGMDSSVYRLVSRDDAPLLDAFETIETAVRIAVSGAAQALTIETVVLGRNPAKVTA